MVVVLLVVGAGGLALVERHPAVPTSVRRPAPARPVPRRPVRRLDVGGHAPATVAGPAGVEASWVKRENQRPGTTAWQIGSQSGAPIEGYADHTSAHAGQDVTLYVSTAAAQFHVEAYRMGWYQGRLARLIWQSGELTGHVQPTCPLAPTTYTISCAWTASTSVVVTPAFVQGDYLFKLVADPGGSSYIPLTVTDPSSHATYAVLNSVLTWEAWNPYGGYDCFQGPTGALGPTDPIRSRVVSFDRPYAYGTGGSADFIGLELPLVSFAEQEGLDVTYLTDLDLSSQPSLLANHRALISLGHNEFWTAAERQAIRTGIDRGVNVLFLGATPGLRPARLQAGLLGVNREMAAYRNAAEDPLTASDPAVSTPNQWAGPPLGLPNSEIVGNTYGGYDIHAPMVITNAVAWPFVGTGVTDGTQLPGTIGGDYDHYVRGQAGPNDVEILAHSPVQTSYGVRSYSDMTYYTAPSGAGVVATGTIQWVGQLGTCSDGCPTVRKITANVLELFGSGPAGRVDPSTNNTSQYYG